MLTHRFTLVFLLIPLLTMLARPASAFEEINKSTFGGVALGSYDAVNYFTKSKAVRGNKTHMFKWKGATWFFSSDENRQRFAADPEAFTPQYGGYCSNQMSLGNLSDIDPEVWRIIDDRLYLFGHEEGRERWNSDTSQRILEADQHWRKYLGR